MHTAIHAALKISEQRQDADMYRKRMDHMEMERRRYSLSRASVGRHVPMTKFADEL